MAQAPPATPDCGPSLLLPVEGEDNQLQGDLRAEFRKRKHTGHRWYRGRWVHWELVSVDKEDPSRDEDLGELLEDARDEILEKLAEKADVVPAVELVTRAIDTIKKADDVWLTLILVDDEGTLMGQETVQLPAVDDVFYDPKGGNRGKDYRKRVLTREINKLNERMGNGWLPPMPE